MVDLIRKKIMLAGWATKDFSLEELEDYLYRCMPNILEVSKDFVDSHISIKKTYSLIKEYKRHNPLVISYAGTTDFVNCNLFSFDEYLRYMSIQASQARFLGSAFFRAMIGGKPNTKIDVIRRLSYFEKIILPARILIEIHGGWESSIKNIQKIVNLTNYNFVIDFQNILESDLSFQKLKNIIPKERIEYYHSRNLNLRYIEHKESITEENYWVTKHEVDKVLWEPKLIKKQEIINIMR